MEYMLAIASLKSIPRSGWITHHISLVDAESVAEHSFLTATIAMVLADESNQMRRETALDVERVLRMAVLHDISEALTFDISHQYLDYLGKRGDQLKNQLETRARDHLLSLLAKDRKDSYGDLLKEFSAARTLEARIVHAADGIDILLQVITYLRKGYPYASLKPLWDGTVRRIRTLKLPAATRIVADLEKERARVLRG